MDARQRQALERAGFRVGTVQEFLHLTDEEMTTIMNLAKVHEAHQDLLAGKPVGEEHLLSAGFSKPVLDAAKSLGINFLALIQLFIQYGTQLLPILLSLLAAKQNPTKVPS